MQTRTHFRDLYKGEVNRIQPTSAVGSIAGATHATQDRTGKLTVFFCDGTQRSKAIKQDAQEIGFFKLVDMVGP